MLVTLTRSHYFSSMELGRLVISTKKGKETMPPMNNRGGHEGRRGDNWTSHETNQLLDSVDQVQTKRGKVGFSFTSREYTEILTIFHEKVQRTNRDQLKIMNRIKVLLRHFRVCHELATMSGGGWDASLHRPIAPSESEYIEMVQAKGESGKFLLRSNFPFYLQMVPMVGGQTARGKASKKSFHLGDPSVGQLPTEGSAQGSEQGSSDEVDAGEQQRCGAGSSYMGVRGEGQSSEGTLPQSQSCGSKRRSTDDSAGEEMSRGKRYKEKFYRKQGDKDRLADAGFEIAKSLRSDPTQFFENNKEEYKQCIMKMRQLGIKGAAQDFVIREIRQVPMRLMFLEYSDAEVFDWLSRNNVFSNEEHGNYNPNGFSAMLNSNGPRQGYPNPNQGGR